MSNSFRMVTQAKLSLRMVEYVAYMHEIVLNDPCVSHETRIF